MAFRRCIFGIPDRSRPHGPSRAALLWLAERINALVQPSIRIS
jgi:hypothetical protein